MPAVFLVSDTHFGHAGVCRFTRNDGCTPLRPWDDAAEMDEAMVPYSMVMTLIDYRRPNVL